MPHSIAPPAVGSTCFHPAPSYKTSAQTWAFCEKNHPQTCREGIFEALASVTKQSEKSHACPNFWLSTFLTPDLAEVSDSVNVMFLPGRSHLRMASVFCCGVLQLAVIWAASFMISGSSLGQYSVGESSSGPAFRDVGVRGFSEVCMVALSETTGILTSLGRSWNVYCVVSPPSRGVIFAGFGSNEYDGAVWTSPAVLKTRSFPKRKPPSNISILDLKARLFGSRFAEANIL